ncbi:MAG: transcription-repair coupling factor [Planctomycetaceae bacterium]|jgi:transcription-repair coupling factor (superfamily II helicase)|nr:transcription-repair coupling factor [Planctomycetaceae bacterium]
MCESYPNFAELLAASGSFHNVSRQLRDGKAISIDGAIGSSCALAIVALAQSGNSPILVIVSNQDEFDRVTYDIEQFADDSISVIRFPQLRELPINHSLESNPIIVTNNPDAKKNRNNADNVEIENDSLDDEFNFHLQTDDIFGERIRIIKILPTQNRYIIVTTIASLMQPVPPAKLLESHTLSLSVGVQIDMGQLRKKLLRAGYHSTSAVELSGEFAVRGYIIDIFAPDWEKPIRVEFFGDEIESIRQFDVATQRSLNPISQIDFTWLSPMESVGATLLDYLPDKLPIALCGLDELKLQGDIYFERAENQKILPTVSDLLKRIMKYPYVTISVLAEGEEENHIRLPIMSVERFCGGLETVRTELNRTEYGQIYIYCHTSAESERLTELFADLLPAKSGRLHYVVGQITAGFEIQLKTTRNIVTKIHSDSANVSADFSTDKKVSPLAKKLKTVKSKKRESVDRVNCVESVGSAIPTISDSLSDSGLLSVGGGFMIFFILSSNELFSRSDIRRPKQRHLSRVLDSFLDLKLGDYVVHISHGIARFCGMEVLTRQQQEEEHLRLEFAKGQALLCPISKINLIQKYIGGTRSAPRLSILGGSNWSRQKNAARDAVFDFASDMIELQARRDSASGISFPADSDWQNILEASFPFKETPDQLTAIEAVKQDMHLSRPMDRLLCGDVGFGKTEVAIRAAFKAVDAGYQVAMLVPTTILAEQHAHTFRERMGEFPITINALSRFQSKAQQSEIITGIALGGVDIVIGTHRILSSEISFHNLGLVIIDEEQRFGVNHKERLKQFRESVDVLTMTATPIPRTLHLSLLGIREISNLETPPEDRLPVETHVIRFDEDIIRMAILRELNRGGQIFFVHNRIADLKELARRLKRISPEVRIEVGHAGMSADELEDVMRRFINHEFDMLVSTTIIESGLDIPNANTIFIDEANYYGLADLHQLRGRVGRFKFQAYCYLVLGGVQSLTSQASKRLNAIREYARLGSGFHIAMRDLEIRGAGNILGVQQSGHIAAVGYEMYCQLLEVAIRTIKCLPQRASIEVEVDLPGLVLIPISYISDRRIKIDIYRRLSRITTLEDCYDIRNEMIDRFGEPPVEVERLLMQSRLKIMAHSYSIRAIRLKRGLLSESGYIVLEYVKKEAIEELKSKLLKQKVELRITEDDNKAYIPFPPKITPDSDSDIILKYIIKIFTTI